MTQAKHVAHLTASGAGDGSMMTTNNTTLPWTGSITTGTPTPALAESHWHRQGAKPKSSALSTSCLRPAEPQRFITEGGAGAPVCSTPLKPREPWSVAARGSGARPSPPPPPPELPLDNRYDILSLQNFPPMDASSSSPVEPVGLHPAGRGSHQSRNRRLLVQPDPSPPSQLGGTVARRHKHRAPSRHCRTSRQSEARTWEQRTPSVLVIGTSMVRHVEVHNSHTFCHPGARVNEAASSTLQLTARHSSASTLVLEAGINDLRNQQSEVLKQDFISLVDCLLDTGKRLIISGPLPPPRYVSFSSYTSFEHHAFVFSSPPILCVTVERSPQYSTSFIRDFSELLSIIHSTYSRILITGDFHLHIDNTSDPVPREFFNLLNCFDFKQHITQPTHSRGHTLDLVITYGLSVGVSSVVDLAVSDHRTTGDPGENSAPVRTVRKRYLTSEVAANFVQILQSTPEEILPAPCDFIVDNFNNKLKSTLDSVAPLLIKTIRTKPAPQWRNQEIKQLKRYCRSAERRWRKSNLTVHFEILRQHLKTYNNAVCKNMSCLKTIPNSSSPQLIF
ncbi:hypothetical protein ABVT39_015497 [Epinephelus coioides]